MDTLGFSPPSEPNPVVRLYGLDPQGRKCKHCRLLFFQRPSSRRYYKCPYRKVTAGAGSDHRVNWNACTKIEPKE